MHILPPFCLSILPSLLMGGGVTKDLFLVSTNISHNLCLILQQGFIYYHSHLGVDLKCIYITWRASNRKGIKYNLDGAYGLNPDICQVLMYFFVRVLYLYDCLNMNLHVKNSFKACALFFFLFSVQNSQKQPSLLGTILPRLIDVNYRVITLFLSQ